MTVPQYIPEILLSVFEVKYVDYVIIKIQRLSFPARIRSGLWLNLRPVMYMLIKVKLY